jgi:hypothetical protein
MSSIWARCGAGVALWLGCLPFLPHAAEWRPVDPALLSMKESVVEKGADVEGIFWDVRVADEKQGDEVKTQVWQYIRLKVFTERGKEYLNRVDLPYVNKESLYDVEGRTIRPDGTIVPLKKESIFDRIIASAGRVKMRAKSFAMPAIEPGVVAEYQWKESYPAQLSTEFDLQYSYPMQEVFYHIKPFSSDWMPYRMQVATFNCRRPPFIVEPNGFHGLRLTNVPAFRAEPQMPPEKSVRFWMVIIYREEQKIDPAQYWKEYGKKRFGESKTLLKFNDDIKRAAAQAAAGATAPEQVTERLYDFVKAKIKNIYDDSSGLSSAQVAHAKENRSPSDTLKRGMGTSQDILNLFGAMALSMGLDARMARVGDRGNYFFDPRMVDDYFLRSNDIAIKVNDSWRIFDPSARYLPAGMLNWREEWNQALIPDPKEPIFIRTPLSSPEKSKVLRKAVLQLSENGGVEGDVVMEYTGHLGAQKKEYNDDDSSTQREETLKELIKDQMSAAELTNIKIENVTDPLAPFRCSFHVRVPGYAQRTGKRIFLQPAFFQMGENPRFTSSERRYDVYFHFPWSEEDEVRMTLPAGFILESPEGPAAVKGGGIAQDEIHYRITPDGKTFICQRQFFFGANEALIFPASKYPLVKQLFDLAHEADTYTLTLKQGAK